MGQAATPPGWYHDGSAMRWWDGSAWGPYAPVLPRDPVQEGKTLAVIAHFGMFACWFVLPLVIRLTGGRDNEYVRHHSTEALNFMITSGVVYGMAFGIYLGGIAATFGSDGDGPSWFIAVMPLLWLVQLGVLAFSIMGAVRASQGVWWRYPISIRFVRGARPEAA
jgi:uncharacterized protein